MATVFHADDFGITPCQARKIISLTRAFDGALSSVSIFANSPAFEEAAGIARPHVDQGTLSMALHANLVEGRPCADPESVPMLVNERGTFKNDFGRLLVLSMGLQREELRRQLVRELTAQTKRYLEAFPEEARSLKADTHQHTHAIPLVLDALLEAVDACECALARLRIPTEPIAPHLGAHGTGVVSANLAKDALIAALTSGAKRKIPAGCATPAFCGIVLSGKMERLDDGTIQTLAKRAESENRDLEILFHPVSIPPQDCLDPENEPFAKACASSGRDAEASRLRELKEAFPA